MWGSAHKTIYFAFQALLYPTYSVKCGQICTNSGMNTTGINTQTLITLRTLSSSTSKSDEIHNNRPTAHLRHAWRVIAFRQQSPGTFKTYISSAVFWVIMQRRVAILYRCFGTTYRYHHQGPRIQNCHSTLRNTPEERRSHRHPGGSLKPRTRHKSVRMICYGWQWISEGETPGSDQQVRILSHYKNHTRNLTLESYNNDTLPE
jgi:hypothetical protein